MISPPPSLFDLVKDNIKADATWKSWLNQLYITVTENMAKDPALEISRGNVTGHSFVNKFGRNTAVGTTEEEVWDGGGSYSWPTSASITHLRSAVDSANTRGNTVEIQGLDTNWNLVTQTATTNVTNSTTEVALTTALRRVFRMKNTSATAFDQNVQVGPTGFATIGAQITAGYDQTLMALYTVPLGKTAYMTNLWSNMNRTGGSTAAIDVTLYARSEGGVFRVQNTAGLLEASTTVNQHIFNPYPAYAEKTDLRVSAIRTGGSDTDVSAGFDLILVDT